jgi:multidrug efflux system membrane fusion protein
LTRRNLWVAVFVLAALAAAAAVMMRVVPGSRAAAPREAPAIPVTTAAVVAKDIALRLYAVGNVEPYTTVSVKARVDGEIVAVKFREGEEVRQGAVLFEIDRRPFEAMLKQAEANLLKDRALSDHAVEQEKRYRDLLEKKFISADGYEQVKTNMDTAAAQMRADEAGIENAKLSLEYCTIRSPVAGYAGKIQIQQGNLVKANDTTPLVVLNQIVPIYTSFSVPEQYLADVRRYQADGALRVSAAVANSTQPPVTGKLSFIDNSTDVTTGTIKLKAEFANTDKALWPGQFVNVVLTLAQQKDAIVTPAVALQSGPNGQYVFVVKPDQTVELRQVNVARTEGDDAVVASGLAPGDRVVTTGQLRLAPGMRVSVGQGKAGESSAAARSS